KCSRSGRSRGPSSEEGEESPEPEYDEAGPTAVPPASSETGEAEDEVVLRMREVPVDSRRGRVSLAMGVYSPQTNGGRDFSEPSKDDRADWTSDRNGCTNHRA